MSQIPDFAPATVSVVNEFPEDLYEAMRNFVRTHPNWDQYRLMQVALAGFLFQQGSRERAVARHYLDGLFDRAGTPAEPGRRVAAAEMVRANGSPADATGARSGTSGPRLRSQGRPRPAAAVGDPGV
jgi:hypothetical protein